MNATTMKESFPIKFNDTEIIFPLTWEEEHTDITSTQVTEDGKDHVCYIRKDKLLISASWKCTDQWVSTIRSFANNGSFNLNMYNTGTKQYETRRVRIHDFKCGLVKDTWNLLASTGIWEVSCKIEEF